MDCPYCAMAKKTGELFCSRHGTDMSSLRSGIFYIKGRTFEKCDDHITRLSLNFNLDDRQSYFINKKEFSISPSRYLLINEGQSFSTAGTTSAETRMITIAFQVGRANEMFHQHYTPIELQLDNPFPSGEKISFYEQTYLLDSYLANRLPHLVDDNLFQDDAVLLESQLDEILLHIITKQFQLRKQVDGIPKLKVSTREEIYRRLHIGHEFIHDHFHEDITIEVIAQHACLAPFYFKRLFKEFYHVAPYQYIKQLRLQQATQLLKQGSSVADACRLAGWTNVSSFIRLFRNEKRITPGRYQG